MRHYYFSIETREVSSPSGVSYIEFRQDDRTVYIKAEVALASVENVRRLLAHNGMLLEGPTAHASIANALAPIQRARREVFTEQCGWNGNFFVTPDGKGHGPAYDEKTELTLLLRKRRLGRRAELGDWQRDVAAPAGEDRVLQFCLMLSFVGPILDLQGVSDGLAFEIVDPSGMMTKVVPALVASTIGSPALVADDSCTSFKKFVTTSDEELAVHRDLPLVIHDHEIAMADESPGTLLRFMKIFLGQHTAGLRSCSVMAGSKPISAHFADGADILTVANERLISIEPRVRRKTVSRVQGPKADPAVSLPERLTQGAISAHGTAFPMFIEHLVQARSDDEAGLRATISRYVKTFADKCTVASPDAADLHAQRAFGLVYAAGKLAQLYGVLPRDWKCGSTVAAVFVQRRTQVSYSSFGEELAVLASAEGALDLTSADHQLTPTQIDGADVLVIRSAGRRQLVVRPSAIDRYIPNWRKRRSSAEVTSLIISDDQHRTAKRVLYKGGRKERMFCFGLRDGHYK